MDDFDKYLTKQMKNPAFAEEWEKSQAEYEVMRMLVEARSEQNMTQKELAEKTGIRQSNISRIESGKCSPNLDTLVKLAKGLNKQLQIQFV